MYIPYDKIIQDFHKGLTSCVTPESAILFLINQANTSIKRAEYDRGHAILDYTRKNFMKRVATELSNTEKVKLLRLQIQRSIIFMGQNNKGGAKLMISVADKMQNKIGKNFAGIKALKRFVENDNAQQIVLKVIRDERFDLNNLQVIVKLLLDNEDLLSCHKSSSDNESGYHLNYRRN